MPIFILTLLEEREFTIMMILTEKELNYYFYL